MQASTALAAFYRATARSFVSGDYADGPSVPPLHTVTRVVKNARNVRLVRVTDGNRCGGEVSVYAVTADAATL
jgi:hypothetical protein